MKVALLASVLVGAGACSDAQWVFDAPDASDAKLDATRAFDAHDGPAGPGFPRSDANPEPDAFTFPDGIGIPDPDFDANRGFPPGGFARCFSSQDCTYRTVTLYCDETTNQCVECTADQQCGMALPVCDLAINRCVECDSRGGCAPGEVCVAMLHQCVVPCADGGASECPPSAPSCVQPEGYCHGCITDQGCNNSPVGHICSPAGRCVECFENNQCPHSQICNTATNQCVDCLMASDCAGPTLCDPSTYTCTPAF